MTPTTIIPVDPPVPSGVRFEGVADDIACFRSPLPTYDLYFRDCPLSPGDPIPNMPGWVATGEVRVERAYVAMQEGYQCPGCEPNEFVWLIGREETPDHGEK